MKKIFALILCVLMLTGCALGEIDLDSMTNEELTELYSAIGAKLYGEKIASADGARLLYGEYTIGTDIPEGSYVVVATMEVSDNYNCYIDIYGSDGHSIALKRITNGIKEAMLDDLQAGYTIRISTYSEYDYGLKIYSRSAYLNLQ